MVTKTVYICDRCGKEVASLTKFCQMEVGDWGPEPHKIGEVCSDCLKQFKNFLLGVDPK